MTVQTIRAANHSDAEEAMKLSYYALRDFANYLTISDDMQVVISRLKKFFNHKLHNQLHLSSCSVLEVDNQIVAAMTSFPGDKMSQYYENLESILEDFPVLDKKFLTMKNLLLEEGADEADYDEYYLHTLAVKPEFRGKGYGVMLMEKAEEKARKSNFKKISLCVEASKPHLIKLYERNGFMIKDEYVFGEIKYYRMVKHLS